MLLLCTPSQVFAHFGIFWSESMTMYQLIGHFKSNLGMLLDYFHLALNSSESNLFTVRPFEIWTIFLKKIHLSLSSFPYLCQRQWGWLCSCRQLPIMAPRAKKQPRTAAEVAPMEGHACFGCRWKPLNSHHHRHHHHHHHHPDHQHHHHQQYQTYPMPHALILAGEPSDVQTKSLNVDIMAHVKKAWDGLMLWLGFF